MKLTKDNKERIDAYFLSKTPEELEYITSKYIVGCDPYKEDAPITIIEKTELPGTGGTTFKIVLSEKWVRDDDPTLGNLLNGQGLWNTPSQECFRPYDKQGMIDRIKKLQEEYKNDLNDKNPS